MCTTHFLEIFSRRLLHDGKDGIKALKMAVHIPQERDDIAVPLFRLDCGVADSSAGIICAKMAGLHRTVVSRAEEIVTALKDGKQIEPSKDVHVAGISQMYVPSTNDALRIFFSRPSWAHATSSDVKELCEKLQKAVSEGGVHRTSV